MKFTRIIAAMLTLGSCGCNHHKALYYRQVVANGEYTYWREYRPTTWHGLCANLYGNKEGTKFEVDHPYGRSVSPGEDGRYGSVGDEVRFFTNRAEAEAWAESVCPTK